MKECICTAGTNVEVFCANPGSAATALYRHLVPEVVYQSRVWNLLMQMPIEAAQTVVHCATEASSSDSSYYYRLVTLVNPSRARGKSLNFLSIGLVLLSN